MHHLYSLDAGGRLCAASKSCSASRIFSLVQNLRPGNAWIGARCRSSTAASPSLRMSRSPSSSSNEQARRYVAVAVLRSSVSGLNRCPNTRDSRLNNRRNRNDTRSLALHTLGTHVVQSGRDTAPEPCYSRCNDNRHSVRQPLAQSPLRNSYSIPLRLFSHVSRRSCLLLRGACRWYSLLVRPPEQYG